MSDETPLFPAWLNNTMADQAEKSAASIRSWAGDCGSADELDEIAADLRAAADLEGDS